MNNEYDEYEADYGAEYDEEYEADYRAEYETEIKRKRVEKPEPNEALRRKVVRYRKQVIAYRVLLGLILVAVALFVVIMVFENREKAEPVDFSGVLDEKIAFHIDKDIEGLGEFQDIKSMIDDNYMRYLHKAYILFGEYPDCEYYKISPNVKRNDFDWNKDFYVNSDGLYYSYFKDGEDKGRVAIDVSEFQGDIEWDKVRAAGVEVAIIRIGYRGYGTGAMKSDTKAISNIEGALAAGLEVGVYFFSAAINREEGIEEANFCLDMIKGYNITQPVIIDSEYIAEDESARSNSISVDDRTDVVVGFCETVKNAGYTPMIYGSRDQYLRYLNIDPIGDYEFWLASYDTTDFPYHTEGYQYSRYGYVDGIIAYVDLDVWMR